MSTPRTTPVIDSESLSLSDRGDMEIEFVEIAGRAALVVDNVYRHPEYVRDLALSLNFHRPAGAYPGYLAFISLSANPLLELVDDLMRDKIGGEVTFTPTYTDDVVFAVITKRGDELQPGQRVPHCDDFCDYAGVLYLNLPEQCAGGTSFWRHRATGLEVAATRDVATALTRLSAAALAVKDKDEAADLERPEGGYLIASTPDWELTTVLEMRFNRLVFYGSDLFHSPFYDERDFGTTLGTRRLAQNLYFNRKRDA